MRNLPKIFLRSFENVGPDAYRRTGICRQTEYHIQERINGNIFSTIFLKITSAPLRVELNTWYGIIVGYFTKNFRCSLNE